MAVLSDELCGRRRGRLTGVGGQGDHLAALRRGVLGRMRLLLPPLPSLSRRTDHRRWVFQWICQQSFDRYSWTARWTPAAASLDDTDQTAAAQIRALLTRGFLEGIDERLDGVTETPEVLQ
jgi:hypothetical protein